MPCEYRILKNGVPTCDWRKSRHDAEFMQNWVAGSANYHKDNLTCETREAV